ncbi:MAG: hypothetical protein JMDDDDMK_00911 [Acidobacteria bacterium]|nr:hypothetical protein [Acidobacteriota bacterium]
MVVRTALEYLDSLSKEAGGDPALEWELATAYQKIGDVQGDPWGPSLGHSDQAMKSYEKAMALAQKLAAANANDLDIQRALARGYFKIGALRAEIGDKAGSYDLLRQSIKIFEEIVRRSEALMDMRELSNCYVRLGDVYLDTGDARTGLEFYQRSLNLTLKWEREREPDDKMATAVANNYGHVGEALASLGDLTSSIENYRQGAARYEKLARKNPDSAYNQRQLRVMYTWLGNLHGNPRFVNLGDKAAAERYYRQALAIAQEIAEADPKSAMARLDLITSYNSMGDILAASDPAASVGQYRKSLAVVENLLASEPDELRFLSRQAFCLRSAASPLLRLGQREAALRNLRLSLQIARQLASRFPINPQVKTGLHASLLAMACAMLEVGDHAAAQDHFKQAQSIAEELAGGASSDVYARWRLADSYEGLARLSEALAGNPEVRPDRRVASHHEACSWRRKALEVWESWPRYGVSSSFDAARREQAAHALAYCDTPLTKLSANSHR